MTLPTCILPRRRSETILVILILLALLLSLSPALLATSEKRQLWQAATALAERRFIEAEQLAAAILDDHPDSQLAAVIAGDAAAGQHAHDRAISYFQRVPEDGGAISVHALKGLGERFLKLGDMEQAEQNFKKVLQKTPNDFLANQRYSYLMQVQGRSWESVEPTLRMIQHGYIGAQELHIVGCPQNRFLNDERFLQLAQSVRPDDFRPTLAQAKLATLKNQNAEAEQLLEPLVAQQVAVIEPYVILGRIYLDSHRTTKFLELQALLPDGADSFPGIWMNRGIWAVNNQQVEQGARCFYEALKLAPNHVEANYMVSQTLVQLGEADAAALFGERAKTLARIELLIPEFYDDPTQERMQSLVTDFVQLNRYWEAAAVCDFARRYEWETPQWTLAGLRTWSARLRHSEAPLFPTAALSSIQHLQQLPIPDLHSMAESSATSQTQLSAIPPISLEDQAAAVGLNFSYFNGSLSNRGMEHIFETTGGAVVAVDYDQDQWPDLYFTQGAPVWEGDDNVERRDHFFRNTNGTYIDVTAAALLGDADFSQGATAGDFNNDGFADLYLCNLYGNRFYLNNGDGTFSEVTQETATGGDEWSLSCVLADLNGDSLPDLYVVNYLNRESVFERRCKQNGEPLTCAPTMFPAEQDRVYLNLGDGRFQEVTKESGIEQRDGKGLAILAADFDQSGKLGLFIGNDTTPNFFFQNRGKRGAALHFEEAGLISGLALDAGGRSQATMGIAFGDIDQSGLSELFVTNFYNDSNTLYQQTLPGQFVDATRQANLREASLSTLGFGTEFLDLDNDSHLDLFVTNGHVDRTFATGEPDEMPPQLFYNYGNGTFSLMDPAPIGKYFQGKYLGRSVSRLDWNRDGLNDLCVLHLHSPVALVTNQTTTANHFIRFFLRGNTTARDAIGTTVTVETTHGSFVQQLVAGDGYMVSNERQLTFGLGANAAIERIRILWPSGVMQVFEEVETNSEYVVWEGAKLPLKLPIP